MPKKIKTDLTFKEIGEAIKSAWIAGAGDKQINRDNLIAALDLQPNVGSSDQKNIVYDFITDQEIDDNTRMVWICVPSPDTKGRPRQGGTVRLRSLGPAPASCSHRVLQNLTFRVSPKASWGLLEQYDHNV